MAKANILSKLKLTVKKERAAISKEQHRREKLLMWLNEQREMARYMLAGEQFVAYRGVAY